uniref:Uncharacterized protein n=1 Tax=Arundo donax TaxID=35708 RepID=A0A0A9H7H0_ARUDO
MRSIWGPCSISMQKLKKTIIDHLFYSKLPSSLILMGEQIIFLPFHLIF